ncbi:ABC transporter ATP-binding protein [Cohnella thermotolerans]|uniref:ATP-binding cassette domain-containing protein n=1 Tax=Cohnella thermotolerans TaxID=329858 RepID=UPI001F0B57C1|nr:ABC transporter ATP-binding protein [Cohnella thermotolerans]
MNGDWTVKAGMPAIRCTDVKVTYRKKKVLDRVTFEVEAGCLAGLLGPNGTGKSALLRLLAGLLAPDEGRIELFGRTAGTDRLSEVSFLPDRGQLPAHLTAGEWLDFASRIYPDWSPAREEELTSKLGVDREKRIATMSRGEEARLQLLTCLSRQAPLIMLDEPFTGVDLISRERIASAVVGDMADGNRTFLIATHDIREMEQLFDRIELIGDGAVKGSYEVESLRLAGRSVESCYREGICLRDDQLAGFRLAVPRSARLRSALRVAVFGPPPGAGRCDQGPAAAKGPLSRKGNRLRRAVRVGAFGAYRFRRLACAVGRRGLLRFRYPGRLDPNADRDHPPSERSEQTEDGVVALLSVRPGNAAAGALCRRVVRLSARSCVLPARDRGQSCRACADEWPA